VSSRLWRIALQGMTSLQARMETSARIAEEITDATTMIEIH
jgi:hypothetical protein